MNTRSEMFVVEVSESVAVDAALLERLMVQLELNHDKAQRLLKRIPGVVTKPIPASEAELIAERFKRLGFRAFVRPEEGASYSPTAYGNETAAERPAPVEATALTESRSAETVSTDVGLAEVSRDEITHSALTPSLDTRDQEQPGDGLGGEIVEVTHTENSLERVRHTVESTLQETETPEKAAPAVSVSQTDVGKAGFSRAETTVPQLVEPESPDAPLDVPAHDIATLSDIPLENERDLSNRQSTYDSVANAKKRPEVSETPIRLPADFLEAVEREADELRLRLTDTNGSAVLQEEYKRQRGVGQVWGRRLQGFLPALLVLISMSTYLWQGLKPLSEQQLPTLTASLLAGLNSTDVSGSAAQRSLVALRPALQREGVQLALLTDLQGRPLAGWYGAGTDQVQNDILALLPDIARSAEARGYAEQLGVGLDVVPQQVVVAGQSLALTAQLLAPEQDGLAAAGTVLILGEAETASPTRRLLRNAVLIGMLPLLLWVTVSLLLIRSRRD